MKPKLWTRLVRVLMMVMILYACGGGGGGGGEVGGANPTYSISGTITLSGNSFQGVTITLSGASTANTTTDASGNYSFTGLSNGTYIVTPSMTGYTFNPINLAITISGANSSSVNFAGNKVTATGTIQMGGARQGNPLNLLASVSTMEGLASSSGFADGIGSAARFNWPNGVTTDGTNIYVADSGNNTIRKIVIATGEVTTLAGTAGLSGSADGIGAVARFNGPPDLTTDGTNIYVAEWSSNTIRKIVISTGEVTTLAGIAGPRDSTNAESADGIGSAARFWAPGSITTDGTNLYVVDSGNSTIRKVVISTGAVTTLAGTARAYGSVDGIGAAARFNWPLGITTDGVNLYVVDTNSQTIRKIVISTGTVTTLVGAAQLVGTSGVHQLTGITMDGTNLYVVDNNSNTILKIVISTGAVTTLAGHAQSSGAADGIGAAALFHGPYGLTTDGTNLYVADAQNYTIRKIQ